MLNAQPKRRLAARPQAPPSRSEVAEALLGREDGSQSSVGSEVAGVVPTVPLKREASSFAALSRHEKLSLLLKGKKTVTDVAKRSSAVARPSFEDSSSDGPVGEAPQQRMKGSGRMVAPTATSSAVSPFEEEPLPETFELGSPLDDLLASLGPAEDEDDEEDDEPFSYSTSVYPGAAGGPPVAYNARGAMQAGGARPAPAAGRGPGSSRGGRPAGRAQPSLSSSSGRASSSKSSSAAPSMPRPKPMLSAAAPAPAGALLPPSAPAAAPLPPSPAAQPPPGAPAKPMLKKKAKAGKGKKSDRDHKAGRGKKDAREKVGSSRRTIERQARASTGKEKKYARDSAENAVTERRRVPKPSGAKRRSSIFEEREEKKAEAAEEEDRDSRMALAEKEHAAELAEMELNVSVAKNKSKAKKSSTASSKLALPFKALMRLSPRSAEASSAVSGYSDDSSHQEASASSPQKPLVRKSSRRKRARKERDDAEAGESLDLSAGLTYDPDDNDVTNGAQSSRRVEAAAAVLAEEEVNAYHTSVEAGADGQGGFAKWVGSLFSTSAAQKEAVPAAPPAAQEEAMAGPSTAVQDAAEAPAADMEPAIGYSLDGYDVVDEELSGSSVMSPADPRLVASTYDLQKMQDEAGDDVLVVEGSSTEEEEGSAEWDGYDYITIAKERSPLIAAMEDASAFSSEESPLACQPSGMNWNNVFQDARKVLQNLPEDAELSVKIEAHQTMAHLTANFEYAAATFGKVIIAERSLPNSAKSIPPFDCGGKVGGEKFLVHGILFKFAIDVNHILRSDERAMKIAGHELKALNSLVSIGDQVQDLHYPMMALIDYRGYRLIALSQLPISNNTISLGSSDAGSVVHRSDPLLLQRTTEACQLLNLKGHHVGRRSQGAFVPGPVDLEGHVGTDNRRYLLDFARLFPPDVPSRQYFCGYLYRLLRPELVKAWKTPLCSDAFSRFVSQYKDEAEEHMQEIRDAVQYMTGTVIPEFAQVISATSSSQFNHKCFILAMHRQGINLRYMGLVRSLIGESSDWSDFLLIEMIARVFKWRLCFALRNAKDDVLELPSDVPQRLAAVACLNELFSSPCPKEQDAPDPVWGEWLPRELEQRFPGSLSEEEASTLGCLRKRFFSREPPTRVPGEETRSHVLCRLFSRLDAMSDVTFTQSAQRRFSTDAGAFLEDARHAAPFDYIHIAHFSPMIKHLSLMESNMGKLLHLRAKALAPAHCEEHARDAVPKDDRDHDDQKKKLLLQLSLESFERALECNPSCISTLLLCASTYATLGNYARAKAYYQLAKNVDETNALALYKYARFLHEYTAEDAEAEDNYLAAIRHSESQDPKPLMHYGKFLATKAGNKEDANYVFSLAEEVAGDNLKEKIEVMRQISLG